jgi:hypothetical protein
MGARGTAVSAEAADMVLLVDDVTKVGISVLLQMKQFAFSYKIIIVIALFNGSHMSVRYACNLSSYRISLYQLRSFYWRYERNFLNNGASIIGGFICRYF